MVLAENDNRQFIFTAAHCIGHDAYSDVQTGQLKAKIIFGEGNGGFSASTDLLWCYFNNATETNPAYPNAPMWDGPGSGVDMVLCEIDPMADYPDVPTVPIISPESALRDQLRWEMYYVHNSPPWAPKFSGSSYSDQGPDVTVVGTGKYNMTSWGPKRALEVMLALQYDGTDDGFSSTTLKTNDHENSHGDIDGFGLADGDSGAPEFYRAPDGTWRMTSVHHVEWSLSTYGEAVPTRLRWVEELAGDQTPCHESDEGGWHWIYNCDAEYPDNMDMGTGTWAGDCREDLTTAGAGGWAEQWGPVPGHGKKAPAEPGSGLWVDKDVLAAAYGDILALAHQGTYGTPPSEAAIADAFYAVGEPLAAAPYLEQLVDMGNEAVYLDRVLSGDFDGDSTQDQLITQPMHDCRKGRVVEIIDDHQTVWDRDVSPTLGGAACGDYFGASAATGDFDGDGYDDVAVGVPGDEVGGYSHAGSIAVFYGSAAGLTTSGEQILHQDSMAVGGAAKPGDFLGESMAVGDFDCDGFDDVAIGAPQDDVGSVRDAGAVKVIYGSATGLSTIADDWYQGASGVTETEEPGDRFGASLAAGNFNDDVDPTTGNECDDLAIGAPSEDLGSAADSGHVTVLYGDTSGLSTASQQSFYQGKGLGDACESGDLLGAVLTAGDTNADGIDDLWVQAAGERCGTGSSSYGHQTLLGSSAGLSGSSTSFVCEDSGGAYTTLERGHLRQLAEHHARALIYQYENPT
ncbi:FG-GAP repeat protein [Enhygromyxa salina]|uniref:FG-GAP repeat protein n=1 Tax=Enhygromyxa salina TaxID=215803 RepID=UPI0015E5A925|nr:FG-GAP repeat protein [Enhygromyxa salina]